MPVDLTAKDFINLVPSAATGWLVAYFTVRYYIKSNEERIKELKDFYETRSTELIAQNTACEQRCTQLQRDIMDLYKKLTEIGR